jgi:hypothetical protein
MTTSEIIASVQTLHGVVEAAREETERAGKNPSWLLVARGAFAKAIEQLGLHQKNNGEATAPTAGSTGSAAGASGVSASALNFPAQAHPAQVDTVSADVSVARAETASVGAAK